MLIRDEAMAMAACARIAKNKDLEADAFEIRIRAERRLGDMMAKGKGQRAPEGRPRKNGLLENPFPTLKQAGIDKNLADRARKLHALPEKDFEELVTEGRADVRHSIERVVISKINREEKHQHIAANANLTLANVGPFPLIYADCSTGWDHFGQDGYRNEKGKGRTPDQHYPTLTYGEIANFKIDGVPIRDIAHKDAALFLWCTAANIMLVRDVMTAWDFTYKTQAIWDKDQTGTGFVFRNQHEILLYGTRGDMPGPQYQPPSVFRFPRGEHSAKPPEVRAAIEKMYPDFDAATRLELFAGGAVPGWTCYGLEAGEQQIPSDLSIPPRLRRVAP
jgi:N6-adenosine-specific RNA methylase IME4